MQPQPVGLEREPVGFLGRAAHLLLHGRDDSIIPPSHSRALARVTPNATHEELAGEHNDFPLDEAQYRQVLEAFLLKAGFTTK